MITIPTVVARMITFNQFHPVRAWRSYFNLSESMLAEKLGISEEMLYQIETSNLHLDKEVLRKLSEVFGVKPDGLNIRYNNNNSNRIHWSIPCHP